MGCSNCKKKKKETEKLKSSSKKIFEVDRVVTWSIVIGTLLGFYGLGSLIVDLFRL